MASEIAALDLSDKTILDKTRQMNGANETMQLIYTLPSGRVVKSEFFKKDQGTKALITWCEVIRGEHNADAEAERDRVRQEAIERRAREQREAATSGTLIGTDGAALSTMPALPNTQPIPRSPSAPFVSPAGAGLSISPDEYIASVLTAARSEVAQAQAVAQAAAERYTNALTNLRKWEALALSLNAQTGGLTNVEKSDPRALADPVAVQSVARDAGEGVPVKRRPGRPRRKAATSVDNGGKQ